MPLSKNATSSKNNNYNDKFSPRVLSNSITDLQSIFKNGSNGTKKAFKLLSSASLLNRNSNKNSAVTTPAQSISNNNSNSKTKQNVSILPHYTRVV